MTTKRDRAAYMRAYRAKQRGEDVPADGDAALERLAARSFAETVTLGPMPDDATIKAELKLALLEIVRTASKEKWISHECEFTPAGKAGNGKGRHHKIKLVVTDSAAAVSAAKELLNRLEGTPGVRKHAPRPVESGRRLEEMTDEELEALTLEVSDGEVDGGATEEAAG